MAEIVPAYGLCGVGGTVISIETESRLTRGPGARTGRTLIGAVPPAEGVLVADVRQALTVAKGESTT